MARRGRTARRRRRKEQQHAEAISVLALVVLALGYRTLTTLSWRVLLVVAVFGATLLLLTIRWGIQRARQREQQRLLLTAVTSLSPHDFERRVLLLLQQLGWQHLEHVGGSGDRGVDLRGICDGQHYIVQCKRYTNTVGPQYVRELFGVLQHEPADRALLVTTSRFGPDASAWAQDKPIELWDGAMLAQQIRAAEEAQRDPSWQAHQRRRHRIWIAAVASVNLLALLLALLTPEEMVPISVQTRADAQQLSVAHPIITAATPIPTRTPGLTATLPPAPTPPAELVAKVANGGNMRNQPSLQSTVIDQIHANETVVLHEKTADNQWYHITNARGNRGWVHQSLLAIPAEIASRMEPNGP